MKIVKVDPDGTFTFSAEDAGREFIIDGKRALVFDKGPHLDDDQISGDELSEYFLKFGCSCYVDGGRDVVFDEDCPHHPGKVDEYMA